MKKLTALTAILLLATACSSEPPAANNDEDDGPPAPDPTLNTDGDCMTDLEEIEFGTDPELADTDGDGIDDCAEIDCVSDPTNAAELCYQCGWKHKDPGNIVSDGASFGNVMKDVELVDQCGDAVSLWDFYGAYHILYMTAAW